MDVFAVPVPRPPKRDKQLLIRLSAAEKSALETEAQRRGITAADLIRLSVNAFVSSSPPTRRKRG